MATSGKDLLNKLPEILASIKSEHWKVSGYRSVCDDSYNKTYSATFNIDGEDWRIRIAKYASPFEWHTDYSLDLFPCNKDSKRGLVLDGNGFFSKTKSLYKLADRKINHY